MIRNAPAPKPHGNQPHGLRQPTDNQQELDKLETKDYRARTATVGTWCFRGDGSRLGSFPHPLPDHPYGFGTWLLYGYHEDEELDEVLGSATPARAAFDLICVAGRRYLAARTAAHLRRVRAAVPGIEVDVIRNPQAAAEAFRDVGRNPRRAACAGPRWPRPGHRPCRRRRLTPRWPRCSTA